MPPVDATAYLETYVLPVIITPGFSGVNYEVFNPAGSGVVMRVREYLLTAAAAVTLTINRYQTPHTGGTSSTPAIAAMNSLDAGNQQTTAKLYTAAPTGGTIGTGGTLKRAALAAGGTLTDTSNKVQVPYMTLHPGESLTIELSGVSAVNGWLTISEEPGS